MVIETVYFEGGYPLSMGGVIGALVGVLLTLRVVEYAGQLLRSIFGV